jgi:hypothetical protein
MKPAICLSSSISWFRISRKFLFSWYQVLIEALLRIQILQNVMLCRCVNSSRNFRGSTILRNVWSYRLFLLLYAYARQLYRVESITSQNHPGGAVGWGTALHAGRSRVRFPMVSLEFFIDIMVSVALWPWGRLSLLTEISTRNISWGVKAAGA